jgi:two-component system sensor histidine kinase KdpD
MVGAVTVLNLALRGTVSPSNLLIIQLVPVVIAAVFLGRAASVFTAAVSILLFDLLFVPPLYTLAVSDWEYFISFIGYLVVALVISILAGRLRHLLPQVRESEATVEAVAGLSRDLEGATTRQEVLERLADHLRQYTGGPAVVLVPAGGELARAAGDAAYPLDEKEEAIAAWVYENRAPAGRGMDTLPAGGGRYLPLVASGRALGVVGVIPGDEGGGTAGEVLEGMVRLGALELDRLA